MRCALALSALIIATSSLSFASETLRLTTLHWPPYVEATGEGPNTNMVRSTFAKAGIEVDVQLFPWNRAIMLAADDPNWIGVYPEYYSADIDAEANGDRCLFSKPFGESPVGFLTPSNSSFDWETHDDLRSYVIGVVRGYVNEAKLDQMIADGDIVGELAENDTQNILKVAARRTDAIVIDKNVFDYLKAEDAGVAFVADSLQFHEKLLINHSLYVCFENSPAGREARELFNRHLTTSGNKGQSDPGLPNTQ
ncbi:substrate-binding periplasmic protein [Roseibium sp.]|uniref:substrate-binding periplasmic protein n=1 Tax=Roseibium sp. TaxID=1936156 RepID=UPI003BA8887A